jgi:hypothetical protein
MHFTVESANYKDRRLFQENIKTYSETIEDNIPITLQELVN